MSAMQQMPRPFWYIAAPASRLGSGPLACRVLDRDLVLFRAGNGAPGALVDRCCHRGVKLSLGMIQNGILACGYHGWRYDRAGHCVHIPSLPEGTAPPHDAGVPAFPCIEQDSYVWVWMGEGEPEPTAPPRVPAFERFVWQQGTIPMACAAMLGIENNLDWCHPSFAHPWTHGQFFKTQLFGFTEQTYETRLTDTGMILFGPATAGEDDPISSQCWFKATFALPDRVMIEFPGDRGMTIMLHFVPTGPSTCRQEWLLALVPLAEPHDGIRARWTDEEPKILAQDRALLESAQSNYDREGDGFERSVAADTSTMLVRRIATLAAAGRWHSERATLPRRRVVRVRT
jgi:phenylpropionate dioxygenase-like ring-hydroxylating dioxygenase large terminal subunit